MSPCSFLYCVVGLLGVDMSVSLWYGSSITWTDLHNCTWFLWLFTSIAKGHCHWPVGALHLVAEYSRTSLGQFVWKAMSRSQCESGAQALNTVPHKVRMTSSSLEYKHYVHQNLRRAMAENTWKIISSKMTGTACWNHFWYSVFTCKCCFTCWFVESKI